MFQIVFFVFGAMFGSAANALIDRLPKKESWFTGRSHCDKCKHVLEWNDLIPIVSYIKLWLYKFKLQNSNNKSIAARTNSKLKKVRFLEAGCRYCYSPIPIRNLLVEIFMGLGFSLVIYYLTFNIFQAIILMGMLWATVVIAVMDWETRLVSEAMLVVWGSLVVSYGLLVGGLGWGNITGILTGVGVIGGIWAISKGKAMGFGDVEIAAVLGWWLGWPGIVPGLWMAFVAGALVGSYELLVGRKKLKSEIAFGPFLILGGWVACWWGDKIWSLVVDL